MKKLLFTLSFIFIASTAHAYPSMIPAFALKDPLGKTWTSSGLIAKGLVIVITSPTLHAESAQKGWDKYLPPAMPKGGQKLVFLEDLSASDWKDTALKDMRNDYTPGTIPILLIDNTGNVRKAFGAARNETVVLVYSKKGKLLYSFGGTPSAAAAKTIWGKLRK
jgi:hypothetical protein